MKDYTATLVALLVAPFEWQRYKTQENPDLGSHNEVLRGCLEELLASKKPTARLKAAWSYLSGKTISEVATEVGHPCPEYDRVRQHEIIDALSALALSIGWDSLVYAAQKDVFSLMEVNGELYTDWELMGLGLICVMRGSRSAVGTKALIGEEEPSNWLAAAYQSLKLEELDRFIALSDSFTVAQWWAVWERLCRHQEFQGWRDTLAKAIHKKATTEARSQEASTVLSDEEGNRAMKDYVALYFAMFVTPTEFCEISAEPKPDIVINGTNLNGCYELLLEGGNVLARLKAAWVYLLGNDLQAVANDLAVDDGSKGGMREMLLDKVQGYIRIGYSTHLSVDKGYRIFGVDGTFYTYEEFLGLTALYVLFDGWATSELEEYLAKQDGKIDEQKEPLVAVYRKALSIRPEGLSKVVFGSTKETWAEVYQQLRALPSNDVTGNWLGFELLKILERVSPIQAQPECVAYWELSESARELSRLVAGSGAPDQRLETFIALLERSLNHPHLTWSVAADTLVANHSFRASLTLSKALRTLKDQTGKQAIVANVHEIGEVLVKLLVETFPEPIARIKWLTQELRHEF